MAASRIIKAIFFDVDDTITIETGLDASEENDRTVYCGDGTGAPITWGFYLNALCEAAAAKNITLYLGLITYKKRYDSKVHERYNLEGDFNTAAILEHPAYLKGYEAKELAAKGIIKDQGLKKYFKHDELVYYTKGISNNSRPQTKIFHGLEPAKEAIEKKEKVTLKKSDMCLIDDNAENCNVVKKEEYNVILAKGHSTGTSSSQKIHIRKTFQQAFEFIGALDLFEKLTAVSSSVKDQKAVVELNSTTLAFAALNIKTNDSTSKSHIENAKSNKKSDDTKLIKSDSNTPAEDIDMNIVPPGGAALTFN